LGEKKKERIGWGAFSPRAGHTFLAVLMRFSWLLSAIKN
jgi:hypothetical protein